jgi:alpha-beta hydrolase superfamily lysophospholipase
MIKRIALVIASREELSHHVAVKTEEMPHESKPSRSSVRRRVTQGLLFVLVLLVIGVWVIVWHVAPRNMVSPPRTGVGVAPRPGIESLRIEVAENIHLSVWKAAPVGKPRAAIIVLHGIADSKVSAQGSLLSLSQMGLLALAPDLRGHGESDGMATYGFHEKADLSVLLEAVEQEFPGIPVGLWGTSYGGAVALQAAASDARFDFVIAESTFSSLQEIARDQVSLHSHSSLAWLAPIALRRAGDMGHFDPTQVSPAQAAASISAPILHLHGERDEVIPVAHGYRIGASARSGSYRFVYIVGGGHYDLRQSDPATYDRETARFLTDVLPGT